MRRLIERPQQFQFFQAVRLIDLLLKRREHVRQVTLEQVIRCKNSISLRFPPSQIETMSVEASAPLDTDAALRRTLEDGQLQRIHLTPAFMGLLGVSGVLPYCYTDAIAAQIHLDKNESGRAFLDSFTHRSLTLFYRAWEKFHVEYRRDGEGKDGLLPLQLALAGAGPRLPVAHRPPPPASPIPDEVVAHYAGLLRHRPVSAAVMTNVLNDYFGQPLRLEQFAGTWETLRPDERACLGKSSCQLGMNINLGPRYWRRDLCVRVWMGPLTRAQFNHFLPDGAGAQALRAMLALFAVPPIRFEAHLILRASDITPIVLDFRARLGRGAVLGGPATRDQDMSRYAIQF